MQSAFTLRSVDCQSGNQFHLFFKATLGEHKGLGVASKKKDARKEAAKDLLKKLEESGIRLSSGMKSKTAINSGGGKDHNEEETTVVVVTNKQLWTKCLKLLPTDDDDFVKQLKIFSLNSNTGLPKYQVSNDIREGLNAFYPR